MCTCIEYIIIVQFNYDTIIIIVKRSKQDLDILPHQGRSQTFETGVSAEKSAAR